MSKLFLLLFAIVINQSSTGQCQKRISVKWEDSTTKKEGGVDYEFAPVRDVLDTLAKYANYPVKHVGKRNNRHIGGFMLFSSFIKFCKIMVSLHEASCQIKNDTMVVDEYCRFELDTVLTPVQGSSKIFYDSSRETTVLAFNHKKPEDLIKEAAQYYGYTVSFDQVPEPIAAPASGVLPLNMPFENVLGLFDQEYNISANYDRSNHHHLNLYVYPYHFPTQSTQPAPGVGGVVSKRTLTQLIDSLATTYNYSVNYKGSKRPDRVVQVDFTGSKSLQEQLQLVNYYNDFSFSIANKVLTIDDYYQYKVDPAGSGKRSYMKTIYDPVRKCSVLTFKYAAPEALLDKIQKLYKREELNKVTELAKCTVSGFFPLTMRVGQVWQTLFTTHNWAIESRNKMGVDLIRNKFYSLKDLNLSFDTTSVNTPARISINYLADEAKEVVFQHASPYQLLELITTQKHHHIIYEAPKVQLPTISGSISLELSAENLLIVFRDLLKEYHKFSISGNYVYIR